MPYSTAIFQKPQISQSKADKYPFPEKFKSLPEKAAKEDLIWNAEVLSGGMPVRDALVT